MHPVGDIEIRGEPAQCGPVRPVADQRQFDTRQLLQRADREGLPLARDQRADAGDQRALGIDPHAEIAGQREPRRVPSERMEACAVEPGIVEGDLLALAGPFQPCRPPGPGHREQALRLLARSEHRCACPVLGAPQMDVSPARLDRERQAKLARDPRRRRAIRIEELRVDEVERLFWHAGAAPAARRLRRLPPGFAARRTSGSGGSARGGRGRRVPPVLPIAPSSFR